MRQIVLDTETTGLFPKDGHRIIEVGCVELIDRRFTGNNFQKYINPERDVELEAIEVHGITEQFLADKPVFSKIVSELIEYIRGAELVIHNAPFDVGFLNHEFKLLRKNLKTVTEYATVFDTLAFARKKHPGQKNNLDALCKRYHIDNGERQLHGALLDARLLAEVYLAMTGGQMSLFGDQGEGGRDLKPATEKKRIISDRNPLPVLYAEEHELEDHNNLLQIITDKAESGCVWNRE